MSGEKIHPRLNPARALTHPLWLGALALLVVNDHVLKSSAWAGLMTGKLSDLAGLLLAPMLLAALLGVRTRGGLWLSAAAVGAVFTAINVSPELAAGWDAALSLVYPFHTTVDPSDLLALPAIPLGLWLLRDHVVAFDTPPPHRLVALQGALCAIGVAASLGSGYPYGPGDPPEGCWDCQPLEQTLRARVSLFNHTRELHVMRVRYLLGDNGVAADCEVIAEAPEAYLTAPLFGVAERWLVQSGQQIALRDSDRLRGCNAALIQTDTAPDILVFWGDDLPMKTFLFDGDVPEEIPADEQTVVLEADYDEVDEAELKPYRFRVPECGDRADFCEESVLAPAAEIPAGARYFWRSEHDTALHHELPRPESAPTEISTSCTIPGRGQGLLWSEPPVGWALVMDIEEGLDGCHAITVGHPDADGTLQEEGSWWLCAPLAALEVLRPSAERQVEIAVATYADTLSSNLHPFTSGLRINVTHHFSDGEDPFATSERQIAEVKLFRGSSLPEGHGFDLELTPRGGCAPQPQACGEVLQPIDVVVDGRELRPNEPQRFGEVMPRELTLVRAAERPVASRTCVEEEEGGLDSFEREVHRFLPILIEGVLVSYREAL